MELTSKIKGLKREPFIGQNYFQLPQEDRLLIVGESHYSHELKERDDLNLTINTIEYFGKRNEIKFFSNIRKVFLDERHQTPSQLWNNCAFYNFIQRVMSNPKDRPTKQEWIEAWMVFFELIEHLKPSLVVFAGSTAANVLQNNKEKFFTETHGFDRVRWDVKIGRHYAKRTEVKLHSKQNARVLFLLHPSRTSSIQPWRDYFLKMSNGRPSYLTT